MKRESVRVDYGGARGSNTGDEFHELWAVRNALRMLDPCSDLTAISVEGIPSDQEDKSFWEGVDCTLLFGGESESTAKRVEIQQLKYSSANATRKWTVARACRGKNGRPTGSLIHCLAQAFVGLTKSRGKADLDSIKISLVTNQPVASELKDAIESAREKCPATFSRPWKTGEPKLHRLVHASGLSIADFKRMARVIDFQGSVGSRFAVEEQMLSAISEWNDIEFLETASRLREFIRRRMLPEAAGQWITKESVLIQFGASDERSIFPCPPAIRAVANRLSREASKKVASAMIRGSQRICFHGSAGVGKTTALQEVDTLLPAGSQMVIFDCYGAGSYLDASKLRHRPKDAFLQLANELAERLRLPALLPPNSGREHSRAFQRRLELSAETLRRVHPTALLVVAVDAADNSIAAAEALDRVETSFVAELMSFRDLPPNVRIVVSARTGRLHELKAPVNFESVELLPFTAAETTEYVQRYWEAPASWMEDFHHLSGGVPRVQDYAFRRSGEDHESALKALRPGGKVLDQVFQELFSLALDKSGKTELVEKLCAALAVLPRPIPVAELASVLELTESHVVDTCADLAPGVRIQGECVSFSDEDFEDYVRRTGSEAEQEVQNLASVRSLARAESDEYAARNVAHLLFVSGRHQELLDFVEKEPEPDSAVIADPVQRREVHDQRLLTAIRVCRQAGDTARALRFVLIGAEAVRTNEATRSLLASFPRLTVRYAKETASRLILGSPDHLADHGSLIFQLLAEDAAKGDRIGYREGRRRQWAWAMAREDNYIAQLEEYGQGERWSIEPQDVAASVFAAAVLQGPQAAIAEFSRCRSIRFAVSVGHALADRLMADRRFRLAEEIASECRPWQAIFLLVPLAHAGQPVDLARLEGALAALKRRFRIDAGLAKQDYDDGGIGSYVLDTILSAAEILVGHGVGPELVESILSPFCDPFLRRVDKRFEFEVTLIDAILRSFCLKEAMSGKVIDASDILIARPKLEGEEEKSKTYSTRENEHDRELNDLMGIIAPLYFRRAEIIASAANSRGNAISLDGVDRGFGRDEWRLDHNHRGKEFRATASDRLTTLIALGAEPGDIYSCIKKLNRNNTVSFRIVFDRFAAIPELHGDLIEEITNVATTTRAERTGGEDKSQRLAELAELVVPISSDDADAIFQTAVTVASELDSEAKHQICFLHGLIEHGIAAVPAEDRRLYASMLGEIVYDAGIRLQNAEGFPWREAVSAISTLDISWALASAARWDDCGLEDIGTTLPPVIAVGLTTKELSGAQAASLLCVPDRAQPTVLRSIVAQAAQDADPVTKRLAEDLAQDCLVGRVAWYDELAAVIAEHGGGEWTNRLVSQTEFRKTLKDKRKKDGDTAKDQLRSSEIVNGHAWQEGTLTDPGKLLKEAENVLARSRSAGEFMSLREVLISATTAVPVSLRSAHLDTLVEIFGDERDEQILDVIIGAARDWNGQWAVQSWCRNNFPRLLAQHLPSFTRTWPWEDRRLAPAMTMAQLNQMESQTVLLQGIECCTDELDVPTIFGLAGTISANMTNEDSVGLCAWYLERLLKRVPADDRESIRGHEIPLSTTSAAARFLYSYLSDVDLRQRWRAAHAMRRLARLGDDDTLFEIIRQFDRTEDQGFRASDAPFYWLAARLWLVIALDRICAETPRATKPHFQMLLRIGLSDEFPHMLIRAYAIDACQKLLKQGCVKIDSAVADKLIEKNLASVAKAKTPTERYHSFDSYRKPDGERRFDFDWLDTLRYWYNPWLRIFSGLTPEKLLNLAETWIVDRWGTDQKTKKGSGDPRPWRFGDGSYGSWSINHGSLPTLERYQNHLEWHAMWCAAGELVKTHLVRQEEYESTDALTNHISAEKLTCPAIWLSDLVDPVPLQRHRWEPPEENMGEWLADIDDDAFLRELFPEDRSGWVVVGARIECKYEDRLEEVEIYSGLVSPGVAHALVRALQTTTNRHDFLIPPQDHDLEIDQSDYSLTGWLMNCDGGPLFDRKDPFRHGVDQPQGLPGRAIVQRLQLKRHPTSPKLQWFRKDSESPSMVCEAWGDPHCEDGPYARQMSGVVYTGRRTIVRKQDLAEFLRIEARDLIVEVGVTRRDGNRSESGYGAEVGKRAVYDRLFLARRGGALEAAERSFESWCEDRS